MSSLQRSRPEISAVLSKRSLPRFPKKLEEGNRIHISLHPLADIRRTVGTTRGTRFFYSDTRCSLSDKSFGRLKNLTQKTGTSTVLCKKHTSRIFHIFLLCLPPSYLGFFRNCKISTMTLKYSMVDPGHIHEYAYLQFFQYQSLNFIPIIDCQVLGTVEKHALGPLVTL